MNSHEFNLVQIALYLTSNMLSLIFLSSSLLVILFFFMSYFHPVSSLSQSSLIRESSRTEILTSRPESLIQKVFFERKISPWPNANVLGVNHDTYPKTFLLFRYECYIRHIHTLYLFSGFIEILSEIVIKFHDSSKIFLRTFFHTESNANLLSIWVLKVSDIPVLLLSAHK